MTKVTHACVLCGHKWQSMDKKTERHVLNAVKVNKSGPYCDLCHHLEMAARYGETRGFTEFRWLVNNWLFWGAEQAARLQPEPEGKQV